MTRIIRMQNMMTKRIDFRKYLAQEIRKSIDCFFEAQKCPNGIGKPFICVRIGEFF